MDITFDMISNTKKDLKFETRAFIGGKYVASKSGKQFKDISPIDGEIITEIAECDEKDVERAVNSARNCFNKGHWAKEAPSKRKKILANFAELIEKNKVEIALLETLDMGKPITFAIGEVERCVGCINWYAEIIEKIYGKVAPTKYNQIAHITKEPVGVVGAITPWNYPLFMAVWKFAPALAMGNSFILKPAEQSPLSSIRVAELAMEAGIPEGAFNVITGFGEIAGKAIGMHMDIDKVSFTGSTEVGKLILQYAGRSNMKRVSLECGGKSPNIIFSDALDLDYAAKQAVDGMFYNSGQVCDAPSRLLVEKRIKNKIIDKIVEYSKEYLPSDPLLPKTKMGTIVDGEQTKKILFYIRTGQEEGANLVMGGGQVNKNSGGYYIEPTIFADVNNKMKIAQDEIFGPVLSIIEFETIQKAIEIANDTRYGLNAMIWTNDLNKAHRVAKKICAGKVLINTMSDSDMSLPHGGFKQSGFGRDKSTEALEQYTNSKMTLIELKSHN